LRLLLSKVGVTADECENAFEALTRIAEHDYQLIFMDIAMPYMDGYEAATAIQSSLKAQNRQSVPIVAVTSAVDREKCRHAGMIDAMVKPVRPSALEAILQQYLPHD
jgi:CheY-like chemotaxis protein